MNLRNKFMVDKKENRMADLLREALKHSIAQTFLIFSGVLIFIVIWQSIEYINLAFFTFFYALINFKIEAIRKHPSLGNYGMRDNLGAGLYAIISWLLLILWIAGSVLLLNNANLDMLWNFKPFIWVLVIWAVLLLVWICLIFYRKSEKKNSVIDEENNKNYYEVDCFCQNCDLDKGLRVPKKIKVSDVICPNCGIVQQLEKKKVKMGQL